MSGDWLIGSDRRTEAVVRIRAAARELLVERGPDRFTAEAVAARAGCSRATLYRTVGGKKALLDQVVLHAAGEVIAEVERRAEGLHGAERVVEVVLAAVAAVRSDRALYEWFSQRRTAVADDLLLRAVDLTKFAAGVAGVAGLESDERRLTGDWLVRVVMTLLAWPMADAATERELVTAYVAPAFQSPRMAATAGEWKNGSN